jgi:hypothetical protein
MTLYSYMCRSWQDCCRRGENRSWPSVSLESVDSECWCLNNTTFTLSNIQRPRMQAIRSEAIQEWTLYFMRLKQAHNWSQIFRNYLLCSQESLTIDLSQLSFINSFCTIYLTFISILSPTTGISKVVCLLQIPWIALVNFSLSHLSWLFLCTPLCLSNNRALLFVYYKILCKKFWICFQLQFFILILIRMSFLPVWNIIYFCWYCCVVLSFHLLLKRSYKDTQ